ncbi:alpha/beta hydrolase [Hanamia caeni]|jgi:acetyl esterase/lipase|uniref:Alpha/beta hydrolase n=1 Tax=Hanamia caeni TaxID=2294116 RepID=A0A3M9N842_9BACT|nr:alpha/beta hydrolase [Hanamia caeni]RNI33525.1 alpha/beta hydrolase [Hanamia caeni]
MNQKVTSFFIITSLLLLNLSYCINPIKAQQKIIQLYDKVPPGAESWTWQEKETTKNPFNTRLIYNVTHPTLMAFIPNSSISNGTAIIVCPGGGLQTLFIEQVVDIAHWLNEKGITAFVLKYRTYHLVTDDAWTEMVKNTNDKDFEKNVAQIWHLELEDAKTAITYLRQHATEYKIDTARIGIMGGSAGGTLSALLAYHYTPKTRPDFVASLYGLIADSVRKSGAVHPDAPPLFVAAATDDQMIPVSNSIRLYNDWINSNHSAELHIFSRGGHGFGIKKQNLPSDQWADLFLYWLNKQVLLSQ